MYTHIEPCSTQIVFETQGEIDIRSFTTFGINVKPNTESPIGYFGTGLKYAIAILTRNQSDRVQVLIGTDEYEFYCKSQSFRGRDFNFIKMRKRKSLLSRWRYIELPFTTEFGKNWEMWQAFRELESNTRDEGGSTYSTNEEVLPKSGVTKIIISNEEFVDCYDNRDQVFLPTADLELYDSSSILEVYSKPSEYLYYRGLRVQKLDKPSMYTYNFLCDVDLTEDRTIKYYHWMLGHIVKHIMGSSNQELISSILGSDPEDHFEGSLSFDSETVTSSGVFLSLVSGRIGSGGDLLPRVRTFYKNLYPDTKEDPDVEITLKRSEWGLVYDVMMNVDLQALRSELNWEEEDKRLGPFIKLRDICHKYNEEEEEAVGSPF